MTDQPQLATIEEPLATEPLPSDTRVSEEFRKSLRDAMVARKKQKSISASKRARFEIHLDRHEAKYIIHPGLVPQIREFIRPFCAPDPHGKGDPPEYTITTIQFDTPDMSLHYAKLFEAVARFKLRVRTYGVPGENPVYLEIKRKVRGTIVKSRAKVPFEAWGEGLMRDTKLKLSFKSRGEENCFFDFVRLVRETGARPVLLVRYIRESYFGVADSYARVTFDRKLEYHPTSSWNDWGATGRWIPMDGALIQNKANAFSGIILEIKTLSDAPQWMVDLVMQFSLERTGNCKYCTAVWQESFFGLPVQGPTYLTQLMIP
jgi:hypothetical protein